jgi:hypothetical protein
MYKKHGRDREANLELQVKALVVKALEEQGLSTKPQTLMVSPGELALVGSPPKVPSSQGSTIATIPVDRIREPTSCILVFLSDRHNIVTEVAMGVAHTPGGLHHNNKIPPDYTRVEVHTMKPVTPHVFSFHNCIAFHKHEHQSSYSCLYFACNLSMQHALMCLAYEM